MHFFILCTKLIRSPLFFPWDQCMGVQGRKGWQFQIHHASSVPLVLRIETWLYCCRRICIHFRACLRAEALECWVTVGALAVTVKWDAWRAVASSFCWGARPGRLLRVASFNFIFSRPPWVTGVHDFMFFADLTALMSYLEQGFHSSFHAFHFSVISVKFLLSWTFAGRVSFIKSFPVSVQYIKLSK